MISEHVASQHPRDAQHSLHSLFPTPQIVSSHICGLSPGLPSLVMPGIVPARNVAPAHALARLCPEGAEQSSEPRARRSCASVPMSCYLLKKEVGRQAEPLAHQSFSVSSISPVVKNDETKGAQREEGKKTRRAVPRPKSKSLFLIIFPPCALQAIIDGRR